MSLARLKIWDILDRLETIDKASGSYPKKQVVFEGWVAYKEGKAEWFETKEKALEHNPNNVEMVEYRDEEKGQNKYDRDLANYNKKW